MLFYKLVFQKKNISLSNSSFSDSLRFLETYKKKICKNRKCLDFEMSRTLNRISIRLLCGKQRQTDKDHFFVIVKFVKNWLFKNEKTTVTIHLVRQKKKAYVPSCNLLAWDLCYVQPTTTTGFAPSLLKKCSVTQKGDDLQCRIFRYLSQQQKQKSRRCEL